MANEELSTWAADRLRAVGHTKEAVEVLRRAHEAAPTSKVVVSSLVEALYYLGEYAELTTLAEPVAAELEPRAVGRLAGALCKLGRGEDAGHAHRTLQRDRDLLRDVR